jgi:hypothetical protein
MHNKILSSVELFTIDKYLKQKNTPNGVFFYSKLSASITLSFAALYAGISPKRIPIQTATVVAIMITFPFITGLKSGIKVSIIFTTQYENQIAIIEPISVKIIDSIKN